MFWLVPESLNNAVMLLSVPASATADHFRASLRQDGAVILPLFAQRRAHERVPAAASVFPGVRAPTELPAFLRSSDRSSSSGSSEGGSSEGAE